MMIFPESFKQFNGTLTKTTIQIGSSSRHLKRLPVKPWEAQIQPSTKYFETRPGQPRSIKNFGGSSVDCPKITKNK